MNLAAVVRGLIDRKKLAPAMGHRREAMRIAKRRAKPGSRGKGRFFHIQIRPKSQFTRFRVQDVGTRGGV